MLKIPKSYILSVLLTAFMATCVCAQESVSEINESPAIGDPFPHFQLTDTEHQSIDLYNFLQNQPILLIYYRGGWWPYCNLQLGHLLEIEAEMIALGYRIIAVSPDRPAELSKTSDNILLNHSRPPLSSFPSWISENGTIHALIDTVRE